MHHPQGRYQEPRQFRLWRALQQTQRRALRWVFLLVIWQGGGCRKVGDQDEPPKQRAQGVTRLFAGHTGSNRSMVESSTRYARATPSALATATAAIKPKAQNAVKDSVTQSVRPLSLRITSSMRTCPPARWHWDAPRKAIAAMPRSTCR